jgi:hypothetical protein
MLGQLTKPTRLGTKMTEHTSAQALARHRRFLQNKESASGSAEELISQMEDRKLRLFFDSTGQIQCLTAEPPELLNPLWYTYEFDQETLRDIRSRDINKFWIRTNTETGTCHIASKPVSTLGHLRENEHLEEISYNHSDTEYDLVVGIAAMHLEIKLSQFSKQSLFDNVYPISATIKGKRILKFVVADADGNVFQIVTVSLHELLSEQTVTKPLDADFRHCGVYTVPLFNNYIRVACA